MNSSEKPQLRIMKRLHTQRQAVDSHLPVCSQLLLIRGSGIAFERDFGVRKNPEMLMKQGKQLLHLSCFQNRRSSAADEDAADICAFLPCVRNFTGKRVQIPPPVFRAGRSGQEVTVAALLHAEWNVHIQPDRFLLGQFLPRPVTFHRPASGHS